MRLSRRYLRLGRIPGVKAEMLKIKRMLADRRGTRCKVTDLDAERDYQDAVRALKALKSLFERELQSRPQVPEAGSDAARGPE